MLALTTNTELLLLLICGINVMEAGSVAVQMTVFKASGRKKRLFRMSPIHHHFELVGWPETTVIIRFWLISAICVAVALGIFISDFTRVSGDLTRRDDAALVVRARGRRGRRRSGRWRGAASTWSPPTTRTRRRVVSSPPNWASTFASLLTTPSSGH